jgi:hypothetical protein
MSILEALKIKGFLKTTGMVAIADSLKREGLRGTVRRYGWRFFAMVFVCYLVRDVVIYILLPMWVTHSLVK